MASAVNRFGRFNVHSAAMEEKIRKRKSEGGLATVLENGAGPHGPLSGDSRHPCIVSALKCGELSVRGEFGVGWVLGSMEACLVLQEILVNYNTLR